MIRKIFIATALTAFAFSACKKDTKTFNDIEFSFTFDELQDRLDNLGEPSSIPAGHAAQTPVMRSMSVHYIEFSPDEFTQLKDGNQLYKAVETNTGGETAIEFDSSFISGEGVVFYKVNLTRLVPGTYRFCRVSVAYQNYDVTFNILNIPTIGDLNHQSGTVASFLGYNTYIREVQVRDQVLTVNANKKQGFWAFETNLSSPYESYNAIYSGQAPAGATTVVNPLFATSPIPAGSCVVTGEFAEPLVIEGAEEKELFLNLSFSVNQSFEWLDTNGNGEWDIDATNPGSSEQVVDMGVRGLIPSWSWGN